jgi:predicted AlkP superfamily pyrophosphatase or phosphodiesterase
MHSNLKPDKIVLVIIDQFGRGYAQFLKKTKNVLGQPMLSEADCIPTVTETMHTVLSTASHPQDHGIIGDKWFLKKTNREFNILEGVQKVYDCFSKSGISLLSEKAFKRQLPFFIVGGKEKVVRLLSRRQHSNIMLFRGDHSREIEVESSNLVFEDELKNEIRSRFGTFVNIDVESPDYDRKLQEIAFYILRKYVILESGWVFTICLSGLDYLGHRFGPDCSQNYIREEIDSVDLFLEQIYLFLAKKFGEEQFLFIVVGDHGCRKVDKVLLPTEEKPGFTIYEKKNTFHFDRSSQKTFYFKENSALNTKLIRCKTKEGLTYFSSICDGGTIRFWLQHGTTVDEINEIIKTLESEPYPNGLADFVDKVYIVNDKNNRSEIMNSKHEFLGDIIVVAKKDCGFMRPTWVPENKPIPLGEHGTYFEEDKLVPLFCNHKRILNYRTHKTLAEVML